MVKSSAVVSRVEAVMDVRSDRRELMWILAKAKSELCLTNQSELNLPGGIKS